MKMPGYKRRVFARAVLIRMEAEFGTPEELVTDYVKLSSEEQAEIVGEVKRMQKIMEETGRRIV